ncbi:DUF740 domain-containing protein [Cephalotus follicularis]|uniref:DUF740 domain-containing protein n=1 Tax=Cephalotus follicularis TaxID=3775 RepID=A0A1Q3BKH7_CEPFO|nr:DUF740 domain-containing protein [Cephalotus follicularis]
MAAYQEEEEVWKCPKHPSKRRRSGICPVCLRERLSSLCPDCAHARPCACIATTSSSSSSASSISRFSVAGGQFSFGVGSVDRVSNLIDREPSFRRSTSAAIPFLRSKSKFCVETRSLPGVGGAIRVSPGVDGKRTSFWSFSWGFKSKRRDGSGEVEEKMEMRKSRSVAVTSAEVGGDVRYTPAKGRGWHFPSPIKVFRQSRISKAVLHQRSPLYRG